MASSIKIDALAVPSLRESFSWTLAGNLIYALCQWGMLSILAKAASAYAVGTFALGLAITAPIFMFSNLQLRAAQATDARREFDFSDYFTLRFVTTIVGILAVAILVLPVHYSRETRLVILIVGAAKSIESFSDVIAGLLQRAERLDKVAISLMIRGPLSLVAFGLAFFFTHNLVAATAALAFAWLAVLLTYDLSRAVEVLEPGEKFFHLDWAVLRKLSILSLPLGIVMTLISLNVNIPRYLLEHYSGPAELGIFASLAYLLVSVSMVVNALGQAATARLSCMYAAGDIRSFRQLILKLTGFGAAIIVLGTPLAALLGRNVLTLLYRPEYGERVALFVIMVIASGVGAVGSFLGYGMTAARRFKSQLPVIGAATLTAALVSAVLVPHHGSTGAALALLASAVAVCVGSAFVLWSANMSAGIPHANCG